MSYSDSLQLDIPVNQLCRRITKNMATFPTRLLYSDCKRGGLGLRRLSDEIQQRKLNKFVNGMYQDRDIRDAYESHMTRMMRCRGLRVLSGQGGPVASSNHRFWAASLLQAFDYAGLRMAKGGPLLNDTPAEPVQTRYNLTPLQADTLIRFGVYTVGDISQVVGGETLWRDFSGTPLEFLNRL